MAQKNQKIEPAAKFVPMPEPAKLATVADDIEDEFTMAPSDDVYVRYTGASDVRTIRRNSAPEALQRDLTFSADNVFTVVLPRTDAVVEFFGKLQDFTVS